MIGAAIAGGSAAIGVGISLHKAIDFNYITSLCFYFSYSLSISFPETLYSVVLKVCPEGNAK